MGIRFYFAVFTTIIAASVSGCSRPSLPTAAPAAKVVPVQPTVISVTSDNFTGRYTTGSQIIIDVNFSAAVTVTGTPQLALNTSPAHLLNYDASSSSKSKLSFTYTVSAGDSQTDAFLDYLGSNALTLNGGTIFEAATNTLPASLVLPNTGSHTSGVYVRNIFIDTAPLTVTVNQALNQADPTNIKPIAFTVVFNKAINLSTFTTSDITQNGTAAVTAWSIVNADAGLNKTFTLTATAITSGSPEVTVKPSIQSGTVQDVAGNINTASTSTDNTVTYDTVTPSIAITSPANSSWINIANNSASFVVSGTCTEGNQTELTGQSVAIKIDGSAAGIAICTAGGTFIGTVNTTSLTQAAHTFTASITDLAGNPATSSINNVTKDITSPTVVVAGPAGSNPTNSSGSTTYTLTFSDTNLGTLSNTTINSGITVNGSSAGCTTITSGVGTTSRTITITGCSGNGTANIIVGTTAWSDLAGNPLTLNNSSTTFTVNNTLPSIAITTPANNSWINVLSNSASFAVLGTCTEPTQSEVTGQTVTIKIDGVTAGTALCTVGGTFNGNVNTTALTQGAHSFTATITDVSNNTSTSIANSVTKDTIAPTVSISAPSVTPINSSASTIYTLTFTDTNLGSLSNATINAGITINGTNTGCTATTSGVGVTSRSVTITGCSGNGTASISLAATAWADSAGNALTANGPSTTFTVDNSAPTIAITSPANNSWINSTTDSSAFAVSGTCSEAGQPVTIKIDGTANGTATCNGTTFSSTNVDTTGLSQATHSFTALVSDLAGNSTNSSSISITRDVTAPVVVVTGPGGSNPANSIGSTTYTLTFSDTNLGSILNTTINAGITINGTNTGCTKSTSVVGSVATVTITGCSGTGTASITVGTTSWTDLAGNSLTANGPSSTFTVDNTAPTIAITTPANNSWINSATDSTTFGVSGTCSEVGQSVTIKIDGTANGTATCNGTTFASTNVNTTILTQAAHTFTATISDLAGNSTTSSGNSITRDVTSPTVVITGPGGSNPANSSSSTTYTLTFSDTNLGTIVNTTINSGITINGTNTGCTKSTSVTGSVATVTITGCSGTGTASITVGSAAWSDLAGNTLTANGPSSTFTVDNTAPTIAITTPANNSWINSTTDSSAFNVNGTCSESGQTVTIKIDGSANGTATCNGTTFASINVNTTSLSEGAHTFTATISDLAGNSTTASGMSVTRDVTAPVVVISAPSIATISSSVSTVYTLTFTDTNLGTLNNTTINSGITLNGTSTGCTTSTTGAGATSRSVTITGCSGNGTVSISLGSSAWTDSAGNALTANGPSSTFTADNTAPTIAITTPANNSWIKSSTDSATFGVSGTCSETSQTVTIKIDGVNNGTASCNGTTFSSSNVNTTGLSQGAHIFTAMISDASGNSTTSGGNTVTRDVTAPVVVVTGPTGSNPAKSSGNTTYTLTFSDTNLGTIVNTTINSGITINGTTTGCTKTTTVAGSVATVKITGCSSNGTVSITVNSTAWSDQAGNTLTANGPSSTFTVDNTAPTIAITTPANSSWINSTTDSSTFSVNGTCSESGQTVTIKIDGSANGTATCVGTTFASSNVNTTGLSQGAHTFTATIADSAGNSTTSSGISVTRDVTAPVVVISAPSLASVSSSGSTVYTLTFTDTNLGSLNNTTINSGITLNGTSTGCTPTTSGAGATSRSVTITGCSGNGTVSISLGSSAWSDSAGNALTANGPSATFTADNSAPTIAITSPVNNSWISSTTDSSTFGVSGTCSEAGQAVTIKIDGTANGTATCNGTTFASTDVNTTALSAASHSFTATISDSSGNSTTSSGVSITRDVTAPTVSISGPGGSNPANASGNTTYTLTFSDTNLGSLNNATINAGITINGTNTGCTCSTTGAGATSRTVTITGCSGDGSASISVHSSAWVDSAGNALTASGPSSTFTIDNTLPSIAITSPANNSWINIANDSSTFVVSGTCTETTQSELTDQTVTIKIDGSTATTTTCTGAGTFSTTVDTTALTQSSHNFTATVTDLASNSANSTTNTITRDVNAPTVIIAGPSGSNPTNISGSTSYTLTFSDSNAVAPVNSTVNSGITINGSNAGCSKSTACVGNSCTVTITGCSTVSGTASISVTNSANTDQAGNSVTANGPSSTFTINNTSPTISITSPTNNSWINMSNDSSSFVVSGTCTEATQSELTGQAVTIKIDGSIAGSATCNSGGTFSGIVNTTGLSETTHSFTASVTDLASNTATSVAKSVSRDVTAPTVVISAPSGSNPAAAADSTSYVLTFSDSNLGAPIDSTVNSGITFNGSNAGCTHSITGCTSNSCTVSITGCSVVSGTVSISVDSSAYSDQSGNSVTPNGPSSTFTVSN